jgi:hypothetical protein
MLKWQASPPSPGKPSQRDTKYGKEYMISLLREAVRARIELATSWLTAKHSHH